MTLPDNIREAAEAEARNELGDHCYPFIRGVEWLWHYLAKFAPEGDRITIKALQANLDLANASVEQMSENCISLFLHEKRIRLLMARIAELEQQPNKGGVK